MDQKHIGIILVIMAILLAVVIYSFTIQLNSEIHDTCVDEMGFCPHVGMLPPISYVSFTITLLLGLFGLFLLISGKGEKAVNVRNKEKIQSAIKSLKGDEKRIYEMVVDSEGTSFQSELIDKSELSKAKVSRILDRLEGKGLIERRRRGMANVVVLKH